MKIAFVIYSLGTGGAERAVSGLANYLINSNEISIITLVKSTSFYDLDGNVQLLHCLGATQTHTNIFKSFFNGGRRINHLIKHLKSVKPDVVISFMHTSNIYSIWACKWLSIPCIISERANHAVDKIPTNHERLRNLSYPHCSKLIVQTRGNQNYYSKILPLDKISIVPNAISSIIKSNRAFKGGNKERFILSVGSFKNGKAQDVLIKAFAQLPNSSNWRLVFLGEGQNLVKFKMLVNELGLAGKVDFKGAQKDVPFYYNRAAMFVFTSEHEGFPNALLEALYFGIPSISTNCPHGPADMITEGENGFLVPVGDVNALVEKMRLLMESIELQEKFRKNALESTKKYEMEKIAAQWMEVIKAVTV